MRINDDRNDIPGYGIIQISFECILWSVFFFQISIKVKIVFSSSLSFKIKARKLFSVLNYILFCSLWQIFYQTYCLTSILFHIIPSHCRISANKKLIIPVIVFYLFTSAKIYLVCMCVCICCFQRQAPMFKSRWKPRFRMLFWRPTDSLREMN